MNTESNWSSENRYQEPAPAEEPQRTARYSWDWPENLAPWWTPPPGLVPPQWGAAAVADSSQPRGEHGPADEPDTSEWDDDPADQEPDGEELADLGPTGREPYDEETADLEPTGREPYDEETADLEPTYSEPGDEGMADFEPADSEPAYAESAARDLAVAEPAGDERAGGEEVWPGVAPAAAWFLRAPDGDGRGVLDGDGRGARDGDGRSDALSIAAGAVPWPRPESDSARPRAGRHRLPSHRRPTLASS